MARDFGFQGQSPFLSLHLFFMLFEPLFYILQRQAVYLSRSAEFAADRFSVDNGYGSHLYTGLIGIHVNNSGNLNPDWLYAWMNFSHPALVERLAAIQKQMEVYATKQNGETEPKDLAETTKLYEKYFES